MNKIFSFFFFLLIVSATVNASEDVNSSIKLYTNVDEQKIFNIVKKIYHNDASKYIVDTSWDKLKISSRSTYGFFDLDVKVETLELSITPSKDQNTTEYKLMMYSDIDDKIDFISPNSLIHELFWNRVDFALGISSEWIDCKTSFNTMLLTQTALCHIEKDQISP